MRAGRGNLKVPDPFSNLYASPVLAVHWRMATSCNETYAFPGQCAAAAAAPVRITTQHAVAFGQSIRVVGSGAALGEWDPAAAPGRVSPYMHARRLALGSGTVSW